MSEPSLQTLIEDAAREAMAVDADDMPGLVSLHALLESISRRTPLDVSEMSERTAKLTMALVQRDVADAEAALASIRSSIAEIGRTLAGGAVRAGDVSILSAWLQQAGDVCERLTALALRHSDEGPTAPLMDDVRRHLHTLKGEFTVLSLDDGRSLVADFEEQLGAGGVANLTESLLAFVDWLREYASRLQQSPAAKAPADASVRTLIGRRANPASKLVGDASSPVDLSIDSEHAENLQIFIAELRDHVASAERQLLQLESGSDSRETVEAVFRSFHTIKGVAGFLHLEPAVVLVHAAESLFDEMRKGRLEPSPRVVEIGLAACDFLGAIFRGLEGGSVPTLGRLRAVCDGLVACVGASGPAPAAEVSAPVAATADIAADKGSGLKVRPTEGAVKVAISRMDRLVDMVGELVIATQMVMHDPKVLGIGDQRVNRNISHATKIIRDLQEIAMSLRLVAMKGTFQKMARVVRDVAARTGRQIELRTEGEETELDRTIVDQLNDPLVHIIRNACDHGIETPADRISAGKPARGVVTLRAFHQGGSVVVEVEDDGRGLDRQRIIRKAVAQGLYPADRDASDLTDHEVYQFIFLPGFSTAETVTEISGRGVGMDVVQTSIEELRGRVDIRSTPGKGTVISMRLPLTMAIIDGMVVRVGSQRFVLPTLNIERFFVPSSSDIHWTLGDRGETARVRDCMLPVHRLNRVLGLAGGVDELAEGILLVIDSDGHRYCVFVDEIIGQQQVVIKSLGTAIEAIKGVTGGAILGDGRVALILDPAVLPRLSHESTLGITEPA